MFSCEIQAVFNRLVVRIGVPRSCAVAGVTVARGDGAVQFASAAEDGLPASVGALSGAGRVFSKQNAIYTFLSEPLELSLLGTLGRDTLVTEAVIDGEAHRFSGTLDRLGLDALPSLGPQVLKRLEADERLGALAGALAGVRIGQIPNAPLHLDYAYAENGCLLLNGWMANFGYCDVYVLANGCSCVARSADAIIHNRPDVTAHVRGQGAVEVLGDGHGFSLAVDCLDATQPVTLGILKNGVFYIVAQVAPPVSQDKGRVFQLLLGARQGTSYTPPETITRMLTPYLRANNRSLAYDVIAASGWGAERAPRLSVIVPFYKEWRFLYSLLAMIRVAPADVEWVIVCDDANIFPVMNLQISNQVASVRERISFVLPRQNVGYGHANNIGVEVAKAEHVLLMNSDIWLKSFDVLDFGLKALTEWDFALVGFTLLFEDRTVQHDGLAFRRSAEVGNRYLALHPGKGLPAVPPKERFEVRDAQAVTGALMLLAKERFTAIGGFSDRYIGGDFEDADLCLALRQDGERIGLVRSTEIFHLERQSIRHDAANSVGFARTLVNCERFNHRWAGHLDLGAGAAGAHPNKIFTVVN